MNDDDMLAAMRSSLTGVKDSLTDVHMDQPASAITERARARRLRRGLSGAGAAATALGVGLALTLPGGPAAARAVHVNLDAWSVNTTSSGAVQVAIRKFSHPEQLYQALARAGVHAVVYYGALCYSRTPVPGSGQAIGGLTHSGSDAVFTIHPAAIPAGAEVEISIQYVRADGLIGSATVGLTWDFSREICRLAPNYPGWHPARYGAEITLPAPLPASSYQVQPASSRYQVGTAG